MINSEIEFACEQKCRICPYPGANCKSKPMNTSFFDTAESGKLQRWMDPEIQDKAAKQMRVK